MKFTRFFLICLIICSQPFIINDYGAAEQSVTTDAKISDTPIPQEIASPLVSAADEHGRLFQSPFDPEHQLYPVRIISIDGWEITEDTFDQDLLLSEGEHKMILIPDFTNIQPQNVFMSSRWNEKHISFNILNKQEIAVGARLMDRQTLEWQVQLYSIKLPAEDDLTIAFPEKQQ